MIITCPVPVARGSSPHTRGAPATHAPQYQRLRIIPAYAGSTFRRRRRWCCWRDHPRIRGEHCVVVVGAGTGGGIIPAYAGSTPTSREERGHVPDHPRIRGEHEATLAGMLSGRGSSPHTRGAQGDDVGVGVGGADHPRIRGEHGRDLRADGSGPGSSPHTRGAREDAHGRRLTMRIIPAYAGSTSGREHRLL